MNIPRGTAYLDRTTTKGSMTIIAVKTNIFDQDLT